MFHQGGRYLSKSLGHILCRSEKEDVRIGWQTVGTIGDVGDCTVGQEESESNLVDCIHLLCSLLLAAYRFSLTEAYAPLFPHTDRRRSRNAGEVFLVIQLRCGARALWDAER